MEDNRQEAKNLKPKDWQEKAVFEFQEQVGSPKPQELDATYSEEDGLLRHMAHTLIGNSKIAGLAYRHYNDNRLLRAKLMCEELGELLEAMAEGNELDALDALADLVYVVAGTAVSYKLPLALAFEEVHRSNMTKGSNAASHSGDKGKGTNFSPPDLERVLKEYRDGKSG